MSLASAAQAGGPIGRMMRRTLADGVASGRFPAELVPVELLDVETKTAAGTVAKLPPAAVGAPSPGRSRNYTAYGCTRQNSAVLLSPGQYARPDLNRQPSDSKSETLINISSSGGDNRPPERCADATPADIRPAHPDSLKTTPRCDKPTDLPSGVLSPSTALTGSVAGEPYPNGGA